MGYSYFGPNALTGIRCCSDLTLPRYSGINNHALRAVSYFVGGLVDVSASARRGLHTRTLQMLEPVLIPAYQPGLALLKLVRRLSAEPVSAVIIVDDGSGPGYQSLFEELRLLPRVHLVRHAINLGKGAALKTGINYALCKFPEACGLVTADADGQHAPEDILAVAAKLKESPGALILGTRQFSGTVPLRSHLGNILTRGIFRRLVGEPLADTQTGLRGIPGALLPAFLPLSSTSYDFELDMLLTAKEQSVPILQQPIRTIYGSRNISSHFNPLIDSMKIYLVLLRFSSVSLVTALIDNVVFLAVWITFRG